MEDVPTCRKCAQLYVVAGTLVEGNKRTSFSLEDPSDPSTRTSPNAASQSRRRTHATRTHQSEREQTLTQQDTQQDTQQEDTAKQDNIVVARAKGEEVGLVGAS